MFKKILFALALLCTMNSAKALDSLQYRRMDSMIRNGSVACGVSADYFRSLAKPLTYPGDPTTVIVPSAFPAYAVDTCGRFRIFYADRMMASGKGFDEGGSIGPNRRALMCAAIAYIESIVDFSAIPSGQYIRLYVDTSFSIIHKAPYGTAYYGKAGPRILPGATGVVSGLLHDFVVSGTDPAPLDYHAEMTMNFDQVYTKMMDTGYDAVDILYYESTTGMTNCHVDLYSTLIHELTHTLGWVSFLATIPSPTASSIYSPIDTAAHTTSSGTALTTLAPAVSGGLVTVSPSDHHFWLNGKQAPDNYPIYSRLILFSGSEYATSLAHLDDIISSYTFKQRVSPGDNMDYLMGAFGIKGTTRRNYTKAELSALSEVLGYTLTSGAAASFARTNHLPWSSKMGSLAYDAVYDNYQMIAWSEDLTADKVLVNDSGANWVIDLSLDTSLHDADGDPISVFPNSVINFRGAGSGGNNHNQVTVSPDGKTITYTPRHNFYGRCQFGYNLTDGKEKGAFVLMTVDVTRGTNVNSLPGENMVVNGTFEEGTEVKIRGVSESIDNSSITLQGQREGRLCGQHFSDGHPHDYYTNAWIPFGSGAMVKNASADCSVSSLFYEFGTEVNTFPGPGFPLQPGDSGSRYQLIRENTAGYYYLTVPLEPCRKYKMSFDTYVEGGTLLPKKPQPSLQIGFLSDQHFSFDTITWDNHARPRLLTKLRPDVPMKFESSWAHYEIPFSYCSDTAANILFIKNLRGTEGFLIDNISIVEDTLPTSIAIMDSLLSPCNNTRLHAKISNPSLYNCKDTVLKTMAVEWTANGVAISTDTIIEVTPKVPTTYIVTTTDGCYTYADTIFLLPALGPVLSVRDTAICSRDSAEINLLVSGTTGTVTYLWEPATGLSCTTCPRPKASPAASTFYTVTVTDGSGCAKAGVYITVHPVPEWSAIGDTICRGTIAVLNIEGDDAFRYEWQSGVACDTCMTTATSGSVWAESKFYVKATDLYGCTHFDTAVVSLLPVTPVVINPKPASVCTGDTLKLKAAGGISPHLWEGDPTTMSCSFCDSVLVYPIIDKSVYIVYGKDENNCYATDTVVVDVLPLPVISAAVSDTAICGAGYVTLSASGASAYSWSPTPGITSPLSGTTTAYVFTDTRYMVTGTDVNGCRNRDSVDVHINPLPLISISSAPAAICDGDSATLTASGAFSYSWSPATGLSATTGNPVKAIAPPSPLTYTVTGTDTNGCTNTATRTLVKDGCVCSPFSVFDNAAFATLSGTVPTILSPGLYYATSDLTISGTTTFNNVILMMEPGVAINVVSTAKLILDSTHIFTCPDTNRLWAGIRLQSTGSNSGRIEIKNGSLIEDADTAINARDLKAPPSGNIIDITNSTFNRNRIGLSVNGAYTMGSAGIYPIRVDNTLFTARHFDTMAGYPLTWAPNMRLREELSTVTDTKAPYKISRDYVKAYLKNDTMAYAGILFDNTGYTLVPGSSYVEAWIGEPNFFWNRNIIDNMQYGFYSNNSNTTLVNTHIINIGKRMYPDDDTSHSYPSGFGWGVLGKSTDIRTNRVQVGAGANARVKLYDCYSAVHMEDVADVDIKAVDISSSHTLGDKTVPGSDRSTDWYSGQGITLIGNKNYLKWNVSQDSISNVNQGLYAYVGNPVAGATTTIWNNWWHGQNPSPRFAGLTALQYMLQGITIAGPGLSNENTVHLHVNRLIGVFNGIELNYLQAATATVEDNTINISDKTVATPGVPQYGIKALACENATVSGNTVSTPSLGSLANAIFIKGYYASYSTNLRLCGNFATRIGSAFVFDGTTAQVGTRWIGNTINDGWQGMTLSSDIGDQGFMYNWRTVPTSSFYGATLNKWSGFGGTKFQTIAEYPRNTMLSKLYVKDLPLGTAERPVFNESYPRARPFPYVYEYIPAPRSILVPNGQPSDANCHGALYPQQVDPRPEVSAPFRISGGLGRLVIDDSLGYDSTYRINQWCNQLAVYEMATLHPNLRDSSGTLDTFMIHVAGSRFAWLTAINQAIGTGDITTAQSLLSAPVPAMCRVVVNCDVTITDYRDADGIVSDYLDYYNIHIRMLQDSITSTDTAILGTIARKCPPVDGAVVYKARALYQLLTGLAVQYRDDSCQYGLGGHSLFRVAPEDALTGNAQQDYTLFPNPNDGVFSIRQTTPLDKSVEAKIYNALGQELHRETVQFRGGIATFKLQNATPGLYLICLTDERQKVVCIRFNVK